MRCTSEETLRSAVSEGVHCILPFRRFTSKTPTHERLKEPSVKGEHKLPIHHEIVYNKRYV